MNEIVALITGIATAINAIALVAMAWKRLKPEVRRIESESSKIDSEAESELVSAAGKTAEGAKVSVELLLTRVAELRLELDAEKKARKSDSEYLRRRIRDAEKEARDYRLWAAQLVKQVVESGKPPVPFIPSPAESEQNIPPMS